MFYYLRETEQEVLDEERGGGVAPLRLHVWPHWKCNMAAGAEFSWDRQTGQLPSEQPTTHYTGLAWSVQQGRARYKHSRSFPGGGMEIFLTREIMNIVINYLLESRTFRNKYTD